MNPTGTRARAPFFIALLVLTAAALTPAAHAQLMVHLKLNNSDFVAYEAVKATVTVHNRAGQDVVLSGPQGRGWLTFDVFKRERMITPRSNAVTSSAPFVLAAGKSITKEVNLAAIYPIYEWGNYSVKASVYFPPLRTSFSSGKQMFSVTDSKPFWAQSIGVPQGRDRLASFREFSLLEHRGLTRTEIYVRLKEAKGSRVFCTYSLGRYINVRKPQATIDSQNRLHVLHMTDQRVYQHSLISPEGSWLPPELFKEVGRDRPTLMIDPTGMVKVRGGVPFNPREEKALAAKAARGRMATERPPGLPR